jgi:hypothetical protein
MDAAAAAAAKAWAKGVGTFRDKEHLQAACEIISSVAQRSSAEGAAVAVLKLDLPRALAEATCEVFSERKLQSDWHAQEYAERVGLVATALHKMLEMVVKLR